MENGIAILKLNSGLNMENASDKVQIEEIIKQDVIQFIQHVK